MENINAKILCMKNMNNLLVSIITPSYNSSKFISQTIDSVLAQTYQNWEMIIVDDASTDNSINIVQEYCKKDSRIKLIKLEKNSGAAVTRNRAIQEAKGRWIAFLDSDDLWLPEKLEKQLKFMVDNNYAFSYHEYTEMTEDGIDLGVYVSGIKKVSKFDMFSCCWPGCLTVMYDQEKIGLIQIKDVKKNNDTALWLKVVRKAPCYLLKMNLARYRRRKNSITPKSLLKRIWAHYHLFRVAEEMNPVTASFWTLMNVLGNGFKKLFYVKKEHVKNSS